jgi:hypothetical protein
MIWVRLRRSHDLPPQRPRQLWVPPKLRTQWLPVAFHREYSSNGAKLTRWIAVSPWWMHGTIPQLDTNARRMPLQPPTPTKKIPSFLQRMQSDRLRNVGALSCDVGLASVADSDCEVIWTRSSPRMPFYLNNIERFASYITENTRSPFGRSIGSYCKGSNNSVITETNETYQNTGLTKSSLQKLYEVVR